MAPHDAPSCGDCLRRAEVPPVRRYSPISVLLGTLPQALQWVLMWTYSMSVGAAEQAVPGLAAVSVGYEHCQLTLAIGLAAWWRCCPSYWLLS